jgi:hypothetical protein
MQGKGDDIDVASPGVAQNISGLEEVPANN